MLFPLVAVDRLQSVIIDCNQAQSSTPSSWPCQTPGAHQLGSNTMHAAGWSPALFSFSPRADPMHGFLLWQARLPSLAGSASFYGKLATLPHSASCFGRFAVATEPPMRIEIRISRAMVGVRTQIAISREMTLSF